MKINGFSIIELMVSVAILAILSGVSISVYQNFISKSLVRTCFIEVSSARSSYEILLNSSEKITPANTLEQLNISSAKACKSHQLKENEIIGFVKDAKNISGMKVSIVRDNSNSSWDCYLLNTPSGYQTNYSPDGCVIK